MTPQELSRRTGRPLPPPLPPVEDLLKQIVAALKDYDRELPGASNETAKGHLNSVLQIVKAETANAALDAKIKADNEARSKIAAAKAALDASAPAPTPAAK